LIARKRSRSEEEDRDLPPQQPRARDRRSAARAAPSPQLVVVREPGEPLLALLALPRVPDRAVHRRRARLLLVEEVLRPRLHRLERQRLVRAGRQHDDRQRRRRAQQPGQRLEALRVRQRQVRQAVVEGV
jgi:hypothetical protein